MSISLKKLYLRAECCRPLSVGLLVVLIPSAVVLLLVTAVNLYQKYKPEMLPDKLKIWDFLLEPLH